MASQTVSTTYQLGSYVRSIREAHGYTRRELARDAGISERLLASFELGAAPGIGLEKVLMVLDVLGLSLHVGAFEDSSPADGPRDSTSYRAKPPAMARAPEAIEPPAIDIDGLRNAYDKLTCGVIASMGHPSIQIQL